MIRFLTRSAFRPHAFLGALLLFAGAHASAQETSAREDAAEEPVISEEVRSLIDDGLAWLSLQQERSGAWSS
ncbi:MAG: hypothetical protein ACOC4K_05190, partial [Verrucomicrobiota bacterium]